MIICTCHYKQCPYFSILCHCLVPCPILLCPSLIMPQGLGLLFLRETKLLLSQGHLNCYNIPIRIIDLSSFFRFQLIFIFFNETFLNLIVNPLNPSLSDHSVLSCHILLLKLFYLFYFILSLSLSLPLPTHTGIGILHL